MVSNILANPPIDSPSTSYNAGTCLPVSVNPKFSSPTIWIVDSGAPKHIYANAYAFLSMKPVHNCTVTFPNQTSIHVHFIGNIRLNSHLILIDVLFIPQFQFNLLSVSALTTSSPLMFTFFNDHFVIQELHQKGDDWQR